MDDEVGGALRAVDGAVFPGGGQVGVVVAMRMRQEVGGDARDAAVSECIDRDRHALHYFVERGLSAVVLRRARGFGDGRFVPDGHL